MGEGLFMIGGCCSFRVCANCIAALKKVRYTKHLLLRSLARIASANVFMFVILSHFCSARLRELHLTALIVAMATVELLLRSLARIASMPMRPPFTS